MARGTQVWFAPACTISTGLTPWIIPRSQIFNNLLNTSHTLNFQLSSLDHYFFDYIGGIELTWGNLDKLYKDDNSSALLNAEELPTHINDYRYDKAFTDHELTIRLPENLSISYELHASKDSKKYKVLQTILTKDGDTSNQDERTLSGLCTGPHSMQTASHIFPSVPGVNMPELICTISER